MTWKITRCLAMTALVAAAILGLTYFLTEPVKQQIAMQREATMIRSMLDVSRDVEVLQVRRYLAATAMGYLLPDEWRVVDFEGKLLEEVQRPPTFTSSDEANQWVAQHFFGASFAGRFFIVRRPDHDVVGYVTEGTREGFKSRIRFFVALDPSFSIQKVEVISHEEDPGLGAEIVKPSFTKQFIGRALATIEGLTVTKEPMPATSGENEPIHAVTGATISSRALTEGVKQAVMHLHHRLEVVHVD